MTKAKLCYSGFALIVAVVAQLVEHSVVVRVVAGSNPVDRPIFLERVAVMTGDALTLNSPELWLDVFPVPGAQDHKYSRGQVIVLGGAEMTGAACLSAHASSRMGAGLVRIVSPDFYFPEKTEKNMTAFIYRNFMPHIIVHASESFIDILKLQGHKGKVCAVIGPGFGVVDSSVLRHLATECAALEISCVLDADGLSVFEGRATELLNVLHSGIVLTPHEGEFLRLFPECADLIKNGKRQQALEKIIPKIGGATLVLKGSETLIGSDKQGIVKNCDAPAWLATAGAGDVLSGMIAGLIAQRMPVFQASCAAVCLHARAAETLGRGLVAGDLCCQLPKTIQHLFE